MADVELHLNATYSEHLTVKSIYENSRYVMGGKLFYSKTRVVLDLVEIPKQVT